MRMLDREFWETAWLRFLLWGYPKWLAVLGAGAGSYVFMLTEGESHSMAVGFSLLMAGLAMFAVFLIGRD